LAFCSLVENSLKLHWQEHQTRIESLQQEDLILPDNNCQRKTKLPWSFLLFWIDVSAFVWLYSDRSDPWMVQFVSLRERRGVFGPWRREAKRSLGKVSSKACSNFVEYFSQCNVYLLPLFFRGVLVTNEVSLVFLWTLLFFPTSTAIPADWDGKWWSALFICFEAGAGIFVLGIPFPIKWNISPLDDSQSQSKCYTFFKGWSRRLLLVLISWSNIWWILLCWTLSITLIQHNCY
jgi:hypothetical protein